LILNEKLLGGGQNFGSAFFVLYGLNKILYNKVKQKAV